MPLTRKEKEAVTDKLKSATSAQGSIVFVNFRGLKVSQSNAMRRDLKKRGIGFVVAKKTLLARALKDRSLAGEVPPLEGEIAIAYGDDIVAPAKAMAEFGKKFGNVLTSVGGIAEGRYLSLSEVKALADIPSREVLYAQFATVLNASIQNFVSVLHQVPASFVRALDQVAQKKS